MKDTRKPLINEHGEEGVSDACSNGRSWLQAAFWQTALALPRLTRLLTYMSLRLGAGSL